MVTKAYRDYLRSDKWKAKRQAVFKHYGKRCYACGKQPKVLHVHHLTYDRLFRERLGDLIPLCVPCHKELTAVYKKKRSRGLRIVTMEFVKKKRANGNRRTSTRVVQQTVRDGNQALPGNATRSTN
jgi:5-methylcytosine-specific restriction endonuclease McrA